MCRAKQCREELLQVGRLFLTACFLRECAFLQCPLHTHSSVLGLGVDLYKSILLSRELHRRKSHSVHRFINLQDFMGMEDIWDHKTRLNTTRMSRQHNYLYRCKCTSGHTYALILPTQPEHLSEPFSSLRDSYSFRHTVHLEHSLHSEKLAFG